MNLHYKQHIVHKNVPYISGAYGFYIKNRITQFRMSVISFLRKSFVVM